jgi:hypothetical protein
MVARKMQISAKIMFITVMCGVYMGTANSCPGLGENAKAEKARKPYIGGKI